MKYKILNKDSHYELLIQTKLGYETVLNLDGENNITKEPMKFLSSNQAENFFCDYHKNIKHHLSINDEIKIIHVQKDSEYVAHYEVFKYQKMNWQNVTENITSLFTWKKEMSFHPQSGEKPMMFFHWNEAYAFLDNTIQHNKAESLKKIQKLRLNNKNKFKI